MKRYYNPIREGLHAKALYDSSGNWIGERVIWCEDATPKELEEMIQLGLIDFVIMENNTGRPLLVTDEEQDGYLHAQKLTLAGITNWHTITYTSMSALSGRQEPEDIFPHLFDKP